MEKFKDSEEYYNWFLKELSLIEKGLYFEVFRPKNLIEGTICFQCFSSNLRYEITILTPKIVFHKIAPLDVLNIDFDYISLRIYTIQDNKYLRMGSWGASDSKLLNNGRLILG